MDRTDGFYFHSLNIHHYFAPPSAYARGIALKLDIQANANYGFLKGEVRNCTITDIGAASDGNANNSPYGVSKAIWTSESSDGSAAQVYFTDNYINNIYGDDAEGFYSDKYWGGSYGYQRSNVEYIFNNEDYRACQRRAMKITVSNATITNSYFESASNAPIFPGAQATVCHFFSTSGSNQPIDDIVFKDNVINVIGRSENPPLGFTDITDSNISNNIIKADDWTNQAYVSFGTGISNPYSGDISNTVVVQNNNFVNVFLQIESVYDAVNGGPIVSGNNFDMTWAGNTGAYIGVIRLYATSGVSDEFKISDTKIEINVPTSSGLGLLGGVFNTWGREPKGWTFDNVDINWTGSNAPIYAFAYTGKNNTTSSFDNTNKIINCDISGASGIGSVFVTGTNKNVVITNSYGEGSTPITSN